MPPPIPFGQMIWLWSYHGGAVAPSGAVDGAPAARARTPRDPRDGDGPILAAGPSPANPFAVAQLLSGDPMLNPDRVAQVLGATPAQLLANPQSILYQPAVIVGRAEREAAGKAKPTPQGEKGTKAAGAPTAAQLARLAAGVARVAPGAPTVGAPRLTRVVVPRAARTTSSSDPAPESADVDAPPYRQDPAARMAPASSDVQSYLTQLADRGIDEQTWRSVNYDRRLAFIRWVFFGAPPPGFSLRPPPPRTVATRPHPAEPLATPEAMRDVIDHHYGITTMTELGQRWRQELEAAGIPCSAWLSAGGNMNTLGNWTSALAYAGRLSVRGFGLDVVNAAVRAACVGATAGPPTTPAANQIARLASLGDCATWLSLDKLGQLALVERVYPELRRVAYGDVWDLLRVALAKYEECVPASEPGWNGESARGLVAEERYRYTFWSEPDDPQNITRLTALGAARTGVQWVKQGGYMPSTGPDLFDCVQGAVGDCYLIAALASLVWTMPNFVVGMGVPIGPDRRRFRIAGQTVDVSERVPTLIMQQYAALFVRNNRTDAKWPGVVEKAYAAFRTRDTTDRPDVRWASNYLTDNSTPGARIDVHGLVGSYVRAGGAGAMPLIDFTGRDPFWYLNYFRSDDDAWRLVLEHCDANGRALDPMVAGSYTPGGFVDDARIVPTHAYSILGAGASADGRKFVVMRNPWGTYIPDSRYLVPLPSRWLGLLNLNSGESGCFALAHGAFSAGFFGFYGVPSATEFRNV